MPRANRHRGSSFDRYLHEQGTFDDTHAIALKRAFAEAVADAMRSARLTKVAMARRMGTSRSQLDRVLDPTYTAVQLDTLLKAASAVGRDFRFALGPIARR